MTTTTTGPGEVTAAARAARRVVEQVLCPVEARGSVEEWSAALGELQSLIDVATAAQDEAVVRLAAVEPEMLDDGELVQTHRALGHVSLDAAPIVSGVLCVSAVQAERRVREAVRRAADGPEGTDTCTGLGGLHAAMAAGRLDGYRAGVVAYELEEVPADVARAVLAALEPHLDGEDATRLRRRVRRVLARISPDLLRERSVRARSASSLRRWVDEPGVDTWLGTFPSEEACTAWAAIDALAQRYVTDGTCDRIERARAKALTDLVTGHAIIDLQVQLLSTPVLPIDRPTESQPAGRTASGDTAATDPVPAMTTAFGEVVAGDGSPRDDEISTHAADRAPAPGDLVAVHGLAPGDLVAVHGAVPGERVLVPRDWLDHAVASSTARADRYGRVALHPDSGALTGADENLGTDAYRPGAALARLVRARDGHCRFPGCHVAARFCDLDHVTPWPSGPTTAANLACLCRRHHRTKQRPGWHAQLHPDATMTWTDPTGRARTTDPVDHRPLTLPDTGTDPPPPPGNPCLDLPDGPHSAVEHHLENLLGGRDPLPRTCRVEVRRPPHPVHVTALHPARARARPSAPTRPPF